MIIPRNSIPILWGTLLVGATAFGEPNDGDFRTKQSGSWTTSSTWQVFSAKAGTVGGSWVNTVNTPSANSFATIRSPHSVLVTGIPRTVGTLVIEDAMAPTEPGELRIHIAFEAGPPIPQYQGIQINAGLEMKTGRDNPARIVFTDDGTSGAAGRIVAAANISIAGVIRSEAAVRGGVIDAGSNVITIAPTAQVSSPSGPLTLYGAVEMDGEVLANGPHAITVSGSGPRAGSSGKWEIANGAGKILFNTTNPLTIDSSAGSFLVQAGTLDVDQSLTYFGGLKQTGGIIDVAVGKTLVVSGRYFEPTLPFGTPPEQ